MSDRTLVPLNIMWLSRYNYVRDLGSGDMSSSVKEYRDLIEGDLVALKVVDLNAMKGKLYMEKEVLDLIKGKSEYFPYLRDSDLTDNTLTLVTESIPGCTLLEILFDLTKSEIKSIVKQILEALKACSSSVCYSRRCKT